MTDFDRASLDRLLPSTPGAPDWDDVLSRSRAHETRRHRLVVLAAAALVLVVGTASAFAVRAAFRDDRPDLPPATATASKPASGTLVLTYTGRPGRGPSGVHQLFFYADGRVIWRREGCPPCRVAGIRTGALEQRLTPEGVERLREEVLTTGLFDRDRDLGASSINWGAIQVRTGGRLIAVAWCCPRHLPSSARPRRPVATKVQTLALSRLSELLADPKSGLPRSVWKDPKLRAYVPSRYAICGSIERPSLRLALLPPAARAHLRGKTRTYDGFASFIGPRPPSFACPELTRRGAGVLEEILSVAGFERHKAPGLVWAMAGQTGDPRDELRITFWPILPHGQPLGLMGG